jgi:membrane associated rhomboid family serine protease
MKKPFPSVVMPILGANVVLFLIQMITTNPVTRVSVVTELLKLDSSVVLFQPWRLFTSMFLHADFNHIFFNMFVLLMFGTVLERRLGPKKFLILYIVSGIVASLAFALLTPGSAVGASGALMGVMGCVAMLYPRMQILFFFIIPMPLWFATGAIIGMDILGLFNPNSTTGNMAHLAGMFIGLVYGYMLRKKVEVINRSGPINRDEAIESYIRTGKI